jgi:microsomal dipeptidase-like Zn-dependent dipeptidase
MSSTRKAFLQRLSMAAAAVILRPLLSFAHPAHNSPIPPAAWDAVDLSRGIIDLHCHPSLKMYLLGKKFWRNHHPGPGENDLAMQVDLRQLRSGYVKGMIATHYLVEAATEREWDLLKHLWPLLSRWFRRFTGKFEHEDETNVNQVKQMICILNNQIENTNRIQQDIQFVIARNYQDFNNALNAGQFPIAHAVEGAHALGRNLAVSEERRRQLGGVEKMAAGHDLSGPSAYLQNLEDLHRQGVCMMTLSHFFRNDLAYPVDGISPHSKRIPGMAWQYTPDKDHRLTPIGRSVVRRMLEIGMIVDITHTTPATRQEVFEITRSFNIERERQNKRKRPVIFSHAGAQQVFEYYDQGNFTFYKYYDASDEEIAAISECNGVIGVLAENFWLVGADTHTKEKFLPAQFRYGIPYIIETIKYINSKTKDKQFDNVAIGTDFDGLADAPKDLYAPAQLGDLIAAMKGDPDIPNEYIPKILSGNARRVLQDGWGD